MRGRSGTSKRKNHSPGFKANFGLEAFKGERTVAECASQFGVHSTMTHGWKRALLEGASGVFEQGERKTPEIDEELHTKTAELAVAIDFLSRRRKPWGRK